MINRGILIASQVLGVDFRILSGGIRYITLVY